MSKILIVGIGGVGGYFGGVLARSFQERNDVSVCFMARGENLKAIKQKGLLVTKGATLFYAHPDIVSDNPLDFGKVDYIILCTKSYDLEETLSKINSCVSDETVFLPLLNGADIAERVKAIYPDHLVADGCVHILSRLAEPGHVRNMGNSQNIFFGVQNTDDPRLDFLNDVFKQAGIDAMLTKDIAAKIWEKFIFISATATTTSYYNKTLGEIKQCEDCCSNIRELINECYTLAQRKNIALPADIKEQVWNKFLDCIPEATTSMHADYLSGRRNTEVQSLTGYVVEEAKKYNLSAPQYHEMYNALIKGRSYYS